MHVLLLFFLRDLFILELGYLHQTYVTIRNLHFLNTKLIIAAMLNLEKILFHKCFILHFCGILWSLKQVIAFEQTQKFKSIHMWNTVCIIGIKPTHVTTKKLQFFSTMIISNMFTWKQNLVPWMFLMFISVGSFHPSNGSLAWNQHKFKSIQMWITICYCAFIILGFLVFYPTNF